MMINKRHKTFLAAIIILLLVPFIAMQVTEGVSWTSADFLVMGILLLSVATLCELTIRNVAEIRHRIVICIVIVAAFLLIWAELAVGIFGTPLAGK